MSDLVLVKKEDSIPPWKMILNAFRKANFTYEDVVSHDWFYEAMGETFYEDGVDISGDELQRLQYKFLGNFYLFRDALLREDKIDLKNERNRGWRLVHPRDQARIAWEDGVREMLSAHRRMRERIGNIRTDMLTVDERKRAMDYAARVAALPGPIRAITGYGEIEELDAAQPKIESKAA